MANSYQNGVYNTHEKLEKNDTAILNDCFTPASIDEIKKVLDNVRKNNKKIKMVGASTFSSIGQDHKTANSVYLDLKKFNKILDINTTHNLITVQGGTSLKTITSYLEKAGLMLNISVSAFHLHMTVAEAISTAAVYGSDMDCGFLASYVEEVEVLTTDNRQITCSKHANEKILQAVSCGLGLCGIILQVTLKCKPIQNIEHLQVGCSLSKISKKIEVCLEKSNTFRLSWFPHTDNAVVHTTKPTKKKVTSDTHVNELLSWYLDTAVDFYLKNLLYWICMFLPFLLPFAHEIIFWLGNAWKRKFVTRSNFHSKTTSSDFRSVTGWAIPIDKTPQALESLYQWSEFGTHFLHFPVNIQFVKKSDAYLSPACDGDVCCISLTATRPFNFYFPYERAFVEFADLMKSFDGRPIWGMAFPSLSFTKDDLHCLFPYSDNWIAIREQLDPDNIFVHDIDPKASILRNHEISR